MEVPTAFALILLSAADMRDRVIPKRIVFCNAMAIVFFDPDNLIFFCIIWIIYILLAKFLFEIYKSSAIGYGDIRIAGLTISSSNGFEGAISAHIYAWLIASILVAFAWISKRRSLYRSFPFAPFLTLGFLLS